MRQRKRRVQAPQNEHQGKAAARAQRKQSLATLRGRKFARLSRAEKDALLLMVLQQIGLVDEQGRIK